MKMATERVTISLPAKDAAKMRKLAKQGKYPSLSAAFQTAVQDFQESEVQRKLWWQETKRRIKEAEEHPERMLSAEEFHERLWKEIGLREEAMKAKLARKAD